jgi:hypothetical protein
VHGGLGGVFTDTSVDYDFLFAVLSLVFIIEGKAEEFYTAH